MKKILVAILCCTLLFGLFSCDNSGKHEEMQAVTTSNAMLPSLPGTPMIY